MSSISPDASKMYSQFRANSIKIQHTVEQLSTGKALLRPGDEVTNFERATSLEISQRTLSAKMQGIQSQLSWYQSSTEYLQEIREILTTMSEASMQAKSGTSSMQDHAILNEQFNVMKESLSSIIDGESGSNNPIGAFAEVPLFLSYTPGAAPFGSTGEYTPSHDSAISLYTGHAQPGFPVLPFVTAEEANTALPQALPTFSSTALSGSTASITLPGNASAIEDVYRGMTLEVTGGSGVGQTAEIDTYDPRTGIATFTGTLATALDATSQFTITSSSPNYTIPALGNVTETRFAEHVWGADNNRLDYLSDNVMTFRALTEEEATYRQANGISATDLDAYTYQEKLVRRQRNIFDPEYGNVANKDNASRMYSQISKAIDKIALFITREDAKAETLKSRYTMFSAVQAQEVLGIEQLRDVDIAEAAVTFNDLNVAHGLIFEVAARIDSNLQRLTAMVFNKK
jgi:flagellin-like hook-associated protein FlgL